MVGIRDAEGAVDKMLAEEIEEYFKKV